jgi:hypothetical protein
MSSCGEDEQLASYLGIDLYNPTKGITCLS